MTSRREDNVCFKGKVNIGKGFRVVLSIQSMLLFLDINHIWDHPLIIRRFMIKDLNITAIMIVRNAMVLDDEEWHVFLLMSALFINVPRLEFVISYSSGLHMLCHSHSKIFYNIYYAMLWFDLIYLLHTDKFINIKNV